MAAAVPAIPSRLIVPVSHEWGGSSGAGRTL